MKNAKDLTLKTNRLLEDINIQLASLNLIFYGDIMPSFIKTNFSNKSVSVNNFSSFFFFGVLKNALPITASFLRYPRQGGFPKVRH
jgi:hypothetical protein